MKGIVFLLLLTLGAFAGVVLLIPPVMLTFVHSKRVIGWRRKYVSLISGIYFDFAAAIIRLLGGTKMYIYSSTSSEVLLSDKCALIICNHRSLVDWMFAGWYYALHLDLNANLRVILKESLRSVPIYGWAMQVMLYIFLSRKREMDIPYIKRMLTYLLCTGPAPSILLFPEGTDLNESNKKKSNAYAQSNNLPSLEYVLYPKPSGLLCCLSTLKEIRENFNMKRTSESNGNNQNPGININENGRITVNNSVSNLSNLPGEVKEHKADCVPYVRAENKFPTQNESKDGYQKEKGPKNIEFSSSFDQTTVQKISGNGKERTSENNANERETILALHDLTIAYKDYSTGKKTSDKSLLYGEFPLEVHILVDRFMIEDVPTEKTALEQWLRGSFYRKEKILKEFYLPENNESPTKNWPEKREIKISGKHPIFYGIFWIVVIFYSLYSYSWFRWLVVVMIITCIAVRTFNGFDSVELALHGDMVLREAISMSNDKKEKEKEKEKEAINGVDEVRELYVNKKEI